MAVANEAGPVTLVSESRPTAARGTGGGDSMAAGKPAGRRSCCRLSSTPEQE
ncbi:MAG: hypothetical protein U0736_17240 [Gemmataceae bacterium]